ncbi:serine/threonine protein kinase [Stanieria cyanosphaera PCC 7437]|uniref:non-specific serine/threonine protein kinase n=1 Tax=Stanieria cyanosphaera (strain ATCC 29371 / PCC 7437) TaxID=111780 RepID=K9XW60_STAC7|nr:protein kinase [Stanieria cyanosphaera]AFZ36825.1 serine/threonine protein kinase [Stanieria cyanosphaera PCC 7437]
MDNLPNFNQSGYQVVEELGRNREGGRITWKGIDLVSQETVVIKQFCFATFGSSWSGYKAYEQEINLLENLNHVGIPRYLGDFETENGFCLVQEYKNAQPLSVQKNLSLEKIKIITIKILEILVYLQQQTPPIFHRDLKPENILVDEELNVYLIDFGFAKVGSEAASTSSVFKGTPGFIPPEQIIKPTTATDLYSLGVTLICLLTQKSSFEIQSLATADNPYQLEFKSLLPPLNQKFINWLEKMVQPQSSKRFPNAASALAALQPLDLNYILQENLVKTTINRVIQLKKPLQLGLVTLTATSALAVIGIRLTVNQIELSISNIAIALLSGIVIIITQIAAVIISKNEPEIKNKTTFFAIMIPTVLVIIASLIMGTKEILAITAATTIAEIIILVYFLNQQLEINKFSLIATIFLGILFGIGLNLI